MKKRREVKDRNRKQRNVLKPSRKRRINYVFGGELEEELEEESEEESMDGVLRQHTGGNVVMESEDRAAQALSRQLI
jgi:hypothetical protein